MKYYLDTNTIIYYIKGKFSEIADHMKQINAEDIFVPSVVAAEIEYGARKSQNYKKTISPYHQFLRAFQEVPFDHTAEQQYGIIRADLESRGALIGPNDLLIAATVLSRKGILVTSNIKEFSRVKGLQCEDWTK